MREQPVFARFGCHKSCERPGRKRAREKEREREKERRRDRERKRGKEKHRVAE